MLRPRVIPCLLLHKGGLFKTQQFGAPRYVGDPLNAVRIFNEKEVDELMVLDIDASRERYAPDTTVIGQLSAECRMPFCYGGGVKTLDQFQKLIGLGVEKVAVSSAAVEDPGLVSDAARHLGSQSVVVVVDVKRTDGFRQGEVVLLNGTQRTGLDAVGFALRMQDLGAGEIVVNAVDRDGQSSGYDLDLVDRMRSALRVPLTALGGAGSLEDIRELVNRHPVIGAAAGSLFVFKGKFRAVLINYPACDVRDALVRPPSADDGAGAQRAERLGP